jgi:AraC-like DNA-binding protein
MTPTSAVAPTRRTGPAAIAAMHLRMVLEVAERRGVARQTLLADAGLVEAQLVSPESLVPLSASIQLWEAAATRTGDAAFGLHLGEAADLVHFGPLGFAILSSATFADCMAAAIRYERLMYNGFTTTLRHEGNRAIIGHRAVVAGTPVAQQPIEYTLALILGIVRRTSGQPVRPQAVFFQHAAPRDTSEHERVFGVRPTFTADEDALVLDASILAMPVRGASEEVLRSLVPVIERRHSAALGDSPVTDALRTALRSLLPRGEPSLSMVAKDLHMSARSLQRKLHAEGTSFQAALDDTRREAALAYLADSTRPIGEVAFLTGFSDGSAFHRAVRRWTSRTPGELRSTNSRSATSTSGGGG